MNTLYKYAVGLLIAIILVNILPIGISYAHGVVYDTVSIEGNKLRITLKWSDPYDKRGISIAFYHLKNGKTLNIGYEIKDGAKNIASLDYSLAGAIVPIRVVLTNISPGADLPFKDIKNTEAEEFIRHLHDMGILNGKERDFYKPKDLVSRAEFAVLITKALNLEIVKSGDLKYKDISKHWARDYINTASENGFISGYNDGTMRPDNNVTVGEACTILYKAFKLKTNYNGIYDKLKQDKWYSQYVKITFDLHILSTSDSIYRNFNEEAFINRANCAIILSRALSR
ncbi:S-layer homology domain-containing protein [Pseudobacteroides cellulosolvens]|uniref:S-layer domain-containing protein n=1 Tax=Pseudobacteroides cellulosolvens ATCC 35603 = DSM 2933 TaxID=398512 RepID=A0A0L6JWY7_9FIRM|nr:S-layer homology domain-containing protein [Pseudobacteroides cellulosolvens]KNY30366.1 S-layer domain-containing protein [Pseudobacteroides cellulosolvens ATCC 35603 = DSM 2933]